MAGQFRQICSTRSPSSPKAAPAPNISCAPPGTSPIATNMSRACPRSAPPGVS
jgi:hypothetical protein